MIVAAVRNGACRALFRRTEERQSRQFTRAFTGHLTSRALRDGVAIWRVTPPSFLIEQSTQNDLILHFIIRSIASPKELYSRTSGVLLIE